MTPEREAVARAWVEPFFRARMTSSYDHTRLTEEDCYVVAIGALAKAVRAKGMALAGAAQVHWGGAWGEDIADWLRARAADIPLPPEMPR